PGTRRLCATPLPPDLVPPAIPTLFPYTTLFRSDADRGALAGRGRYSGGIHPARSSRRVQRLSGRERCGSLVAHLAERRHLCPTRSEEHTSELQSRVDLVCRLPLEKKKRGRALGP